MRGEEAFERHSRYISPTFVKLLRTLGYGRLFVRAEGTRLWDSEGKEYLDLMSGCGSVNLGYNHPDILEAAASALRSHAPSFLQVAPLEEAGLLAEALAARLGPKLSMAFFCNSGSEAVEGALKLAFAATRRTGVVYCRGSFHGMTLGALSVMGEERYRGPFPSLPDCEMIAFGDVDGAERALRKKRVAALIVEPIQIEAGVRMAPGSYFAALEELCRKYGTLLVFDEVQTGMGRTGHLFAFQEIGVVPDVLCYAKGFSGGLMPIGGYSTSEKWLGRAYGRVQDIELHSTTYGGSSLACAVARRNLELVDDALLAQVRALGEHVGERLRAMVAGSPAMEAARGRGLVWALQFAPPTKGAGRLLTLGVPNLVSKALFAHWVAVRLLELGFVTETLSHDETTLRFQPALTIQLSDIDRFFDALSAVLTENESFGTFAAHAGARLLERHLGRGGPHP